MKKIGRSYPLPALRPRKPLQEFLAICLLPRRGPLLINCLPRTSRGDQGPAFEGLNVDGGDLGTGFHPRDAEAFSIAQPDLQGRELECKRELIGDLAVNSRPAVKDVTLH
jgi:hypothetical protein